MAETPTRSVPAAESLCLSSRLVVRPTDMPGRHVIKDRETNAFFHVGDQECFLLTAMDGQTDGPTLRGRFEERFGEPLSVEDLDGFIELGLKQRLLESSQAPSASRRRGPRQTPLYFRLNLLNPDRLFDWLAPKIAFVWTPAFVLATLILIAIAGAILATDGQEWLRKIPSRLDFRTVAFVTIAVTGVTLLHECAHGLTCKHFGGEVREIGFLWIMFMPCMYCNVSDAWLFREKWKRIWVGAAGIHLDLLVWAVMTITWRATVVESDANYLAWVTGSVCFTRTFFNLNPLLRLDGYYLLSDLLGVANLSSTGPKLWGGTIQCALWGGPRPKWPERGQAILFWGIGNWLFICSFFAGVLMSLVRVAALESVPWRLPLTLCLGWLLGRNLWKTVFGREFTRMFWRRPLRAGAWLAALAVAFVLANTVQMRDYASAQARIQPTVHREIVAPVAGFLEIARPGEGDSVEAGEPVAVIRIPSLESELAVTRAQLCEAEAQVKRLETGRRAEEISAQQEAVARAEVWRDEGKRELSHFQQSAAKTLASDDLRIARARAQAAQSRRLWEQSRRLRSNGAVTGEQLLEAARASETAELEAARAEAERNNHAQTLTLDAESEAVSRARQLDDERARLRLLTAGSRPERIDEARARVDRVREQLAFLEDTQRRTVVRAPVSGIVATPRLGERQGQAVTPGTVICVVQESSELQAELQVAEGVVDGISPGDDVELRLAALPFRPLSAKVDRVVASVMLPAESAMLRASPAGPIGPDSRVAAAGNPPDNLARGATGNTRKADSWHRQSTSGWGVADSPASGAASFDSPSPKPTGEAPEAMAAGAASASATSAGAASVTPLSGAPGGSSMTAGRSARDQAMPVSSSSKRGREFSKENRRGTVSVLCRLDPVDTELLAGATGKARVYREPCSVLQFCWRRVQRHCRAELWLW